MTTSFERTAIAFAWRRCKMRETPQPCDSGMASDGCSTAQPNFEGFSLSLAVATEAEADRRFAALAEGGQVQMPMAKTFWSPRFGMVKDRFGVGWMVSVAP
jgi:PhnB protein